MSVYLPEKAYVVCTSQLGPGPKQLLIDREIRSNITVIFKSQERPFLVKLDKCLSDDFTCKTGWSSGAGTAAVGAGVLTGLAIAASVATVPIAGWIVGGAIAVGTVFIGIGAWLMATSPTCSEMIGFEESKWQKVHPTVKFDSSKVQMKDKHKAVLNTSILACKEGGLLLPFISKEKAEQAGWKIWKNNQSELWLNVGVGFFSGFSLGFGFGWAALGQFAVWTGFGYLVINPLSQNFGEGTAELIGGDSYEGLKDAQNDVPDRGILPTDNYDLSSVAQTSSDINRIGELMRQNGANQQQILDMRAAIAESQRNGGSFSRQNNPRAANVLNRIQSGDFGPEVREMFTNRSGNARGMNRQQNYERSVNSKQQNIRANRGQAAARGARATASIIALLTPFISAYLGERALIVAGEIWAEDETDSISVLSEK